MKRMAVGEASFLFSLLACVLAVVFDTFCSINIYIYTPEYIAPIHTGTGSNTRSSVISSNNNFVSKNVLGTAAPRKY